MFVWIRFPFSIADVLMCYARCVIFCIFFIDDTSRIRRSRIQDWLDPLDLYPYTSSQSDIYGIFQKTVVEHNRTWRLCSTMLAC